MRETHEQLYDRHRRAFLKASLAGGLGAMAGCIGGGQGGGSGDGGDGGDGGPVEGDTPAERAINAVNQLDKPDTLDLLVWSGSEAYFEKVREQWVDQTGIDFELHGFGITETYGKILNEATTQSPQFDINVTENFGTPDYFRSGYAAEITDWARRYDPELENVLPVARRWGVFDDKLVALPSDSDVMQPFVRTDWVDDDEFGAEYEAQYGEQLRRPETVAEYDRQIRFFTENTDDGVYGGWLYMAPFFAKWTFIRRLLQRGELLFDEEFRPNFDTDAGVAVLEELRALKPFLHPEVGNAGFGVPYTEFPAGNIYTTVQWPSLFRTLTQGDVAIGVDQWEPIRAVGREVDGQLLRPAQYTLGQAFRVNANGPAPEVSYLFCQWLTDLQVSTEAIQAGGFIEPFREAHFEDEALGQFLAGDDWQSDFEVFERNFRSSYPDLTVLRVNEYNSAIDKAVTNVLNNDRDPESELAGAAEKCEEITEAVGRDAQAAQWRYMTSIYGDTLREVLDLPDPPEQMPHER
jgi:ABC-type glycerol-3-phosphate transport system substrate-binding protein